MKRILLTGGGSAGHVTPNMALFPQLRAEGYDIHYAGTKNGMERALIENEKGVTYHVISSGKLRRSFKPKQVAENLATPFLVVKGLAESASLMRKLKPDVVFSKGGFVSVPVVIAASNLGIPVVTHESDYTPGLANKINLRFAKSICVTFEDTLSDVGEKGVHTGTPIRPEIYSGDKKRGLGMLGFDGKKPVLLIMGGSQGAAIINRSVREALPRLLMAYDVVHLCGKGKNDESLNGMAGYRQYEYMSGELPDALAGADIIVSRSGTNAIFEFLALSKPMLLIPLSRAESRGDQILNAGYFARKGYAMVLEQESLSPDTLFDSVNDLYDRRLSFISTMSADALADGTDEVLSVIRAAALKGKK